MTTSHSENKIVTNDIDKDSGLLIGIKEADFIHRYVEKNVEKIKGTKLKQGSVLELDGEKCILTRSILIDENGNAFIVTKAKDKRYTEEELIQKYLSRNPYERLAMNTRYYFEDGSSFQYRMINRIKTFFFTGKFALGQGTYSKVKKIQDLKTKKMFAVKTTLFINDHYKKIFLNEINNEKKLERLVGKLEQNNKGYLILPLVEGQSLSQYVAENEEFTLAKIIDLILKIAYELKKLHDKGIIHSDLHSDNIFFDGKNMVIIDLGMSIFVEKNNIMYKNAFYTGFNEENLRKYPYHAPELIQENKGNSVSFQSDIYSLGEYVLQFLLKYTANITESNQLNSINSLVKQMKDLDAEKRPTLEDVIKYFKNIAVTLTKEAKTVLFAPILTTKNNKRPVSGTLDDERPLKRRKKESGDAPLLVNIK